MTYKCIMQMLIFKPTKAGAMDVKEDKPLRNPGSR